MQSHPYFSSSQNVGDEIPLDIVFDQEPVEGLSFNNGKIYVNTKDPTLYQRLHQQAVERFMEENGNQLDQGLNNILGEQHEGVNKLFPHLSTQLGVDQS